MRRGGGGLVAALGGGGGLRGGATRGWLGEAVSLREEEALGGWLGSLKRGSRRVGPTRQR
jgi:hypothetical protein